MTRVRKVSLGLMALLVAVAVGGGISACGGKDETLAYGYGEEGTYYYTESSGDDLLTLRQGTYILTLGSSGYAGTYEYEDGALTLYEGEGETGSGTLTDSGVSLTYGGKTYLFLTYEYYTVTFTDGSSTLTTQSVLNGKAATDPGDAEKEGYVFLGWYSDASYTERYEFNTAVTDNTTIYARFVEVEGTTEYNITYDFGNGETYTEETLNGKIYDLPEAEMAGYTFLGWWVSATNNADELTYKYTDETLYEDTTLYAVYASGSYIGASIKDGVLTWLNAPGSQMSVTVTDEKGSAVASWDQQATQTVGYDFTSLSSGKYTVEVTSGGITETLTYVSNGLYRTSGFTVISGSILMYGAVANAEGYYITIDCGNPSHDHSLIDNGTSLYYDFSSCDMPATGITFTVYVYADGYYYSVSSYNYFLGLDNTEVKVEGNEITWETVPYAMSYEVYIDGTLVATVSGTSYSLSNYGTGTYEIAVRPTTTGYYSEISESISFTKMSLAAPRITGIADYTVTWTEVEGATGYIVSINGKETTINDGTITSLILTDDNYTEGLDEYEISVKAMAADSNNDSPYSDAITVTGTSVGSAVSYGNGTVTWQYSLNAVEYRITVNDGDETIVTGTNSASITLTKSGNNEITIYFIDDEDNIYGTAGITVYAYAIVFDARGGSAILNGEEIDAVYVAKGDTIVLPEAETAGYVFAGWYTLPDVSGSSWSEAFEYVGDGYLFEEDTVFTGNATMVLYAFYTPRLYTITVNAAGGYFVDEDGKALTEDDGSYVTTLTQTVYYGQEYSLPRAVSTDPTRQFYGWYSEPNSVGTRYSDDRGNAYGAWRVAYDTTLYAGYVEVLAFELTTYAGESVYAAKKSSSLNDYADVTEITIPDEYNGLKVAVLQSNAFNSLKYVETVNIPDTMEYVSTVNNGYSSGSGAFASSSCITAVNVYATGDELDPTKEVTYYSYDGVLYQKNSITGYVELIYFPYGKTAGGLVIPETVSNETEAELDASMNAVPVTRSVTSIATKVFQSNTTLTSVTIPATVENVDSQAFYNCTKLTSVTFLTKCESAEAQAADSVFVYGNAFQSCTALTEVTLPANLTDFDYTIFSSCSKLTDVYVNSTGSSARDNYASSEGTLVSADGGTLIYYPVGRTEFTLSDTRVTTIGESALYGNKNITAVTIPAFVTRIEDSAFYNCTAMKELSFDGDAYSNNMYIESYAFYGCTALTAVELPVNLYSLSEYSFGGCSKLTTVSFDARPGATSLAFDDNAFANTSGSFYVTTLNIGANVPEIDIAGVFGYNISSVTIDASNPNYVTSADGVVYNASATAILYCPAGYSGELVLPDTITYIGSNVFRAKNIRGITIPASVEYIEERAFYNCKSLLYVTFTGEREAESLTIGDYAFYGCSVLLEINLPYGLTEIGDRAFYGCSALQSVTIPEGVTTLGDYLFYNCSALTYICIPASVTQIGSADNGCYYVFYGCKALETVEIAEGSTSFAVIDGILYGLSAEGEPATLYAALSAVEGTLVIPSTVTEIKYRAFYNNSSITAISFDGEVSGLAIGSEAFSGCSNLSSVTLPVGLTSLGASTFNNCTKLKSITIPYTVMSMANSIFSGCSALTDIFFEDTPEGVTPVTLTLTAGTTSASVFSGTAVENVYFPERLYSIPTYTFYKFTTIKYVYIPSTVTEIGAAAFASSSIVEVDFAEGSSLTTLGKAAFALCTSLKQMVLPEGLTTITAGTASNSAGTYSTGGAFDGDTSLTYMYVPSTLTAITTHTFYGCTSLIEVGIGEGSVCTEIGNYAFSGCTALRGLDIPEGVTSVGERTFQNCTAFTSVTLPGNVASLGNYAFYGCSALTEMNFSASLTSIGNYAFSGCTALTEASFSESIQSLGTYVFNGCTALEKVEFAVGADGLSALSSIGNYCFTGTAVEELILPETASTLSLGYFLFNGCENLYRVHISSGVTSLQWVFREEDCESDYTITEFTISEGNQNFAAYDYDGITYVFNAAGNVLRGAFGKAEMTLDLPAVNGKTLSNGNIVNLTEIGDHALSHRSDIKSITVPYTVTSIGTNAFLYCIGLEELLFEELPSNLPMEDYDLVLTAGTSSGPSMTATTTTSYGSFGACRGLVYVALPERMTSIPAYSFHGSSALEYFHIPSTVVSVGRNIIATSSSSFQNAVLETIEFADGSSLTTIDQYAFAYCKGLKNINLPEGLTGFTGNYVFSNCSALETIVFPSTFRTWTGTYTFQNCTSLRSVILSEGITDIPNYSFASCTSLESIVIPYTVETIGNCAFQSCTSLKEVIFEATPEDKEEAPLTINNGSGSTSGAFVSCTSLYSVCFPLRTVTTGAYTFNKCSSLTVVTYEDDENFDSSKDYSTDGYFALPDGIAIGNYCFYQCTSLTYADISNLDIGNVGTYAFYMCTGITHIDIPADCTSIPTGLYYGCTSITEIEIPSTVTSLGTYAFYQTGISSVVVPAGVSEIPGYCFYDCESLENVTFLGKVDTVGQCAFSYCTSLKQLDLTDVSSIGNQAFRYSGLTSVYLPSYTNPGSETTIFADCPDLETVILSPEINKLYTGFFQNTPSLTRIYYDGYEGEDNVLPDSVTSIGSYVFNGSGIDNITIPASVTTWSSGSAAASGEFGNCENLTTVVLPEGFLTISSYSFAGCTSLESITIPYTVTTIGYSAFSGCSALEELIFEETPVGESAQNLVFWGGISASYAVFQDCVSLEEINLPERTTELGGYMFSGCSSLRYVYIPSTVNYFLRGNSATSNATYAYTFYGCEALEEVVFGAGSAIDEIKSYTFSNCTSLTTINLPDSVTSIGTYAFQYCSSLASITFPSGLTTIGNYAFRYSGLTEVTIPSYVSSIGTYTFANCTSLLDITVVSTNVTYSSVDGVVYNASGALAIYPAGREGDVFLEDGTTLANYAFYGCEKITGIYLPDSVDSVPTYCFYGCASLEWAYISDGTTSMSTYTFSGCTSLRYVILGSGLTSIGNYSFQNCSSLEYVFYHGTEEDKDEFLSIGTSNNTALTGAAWYYYSETEPALSDSGDAYEGNFWRWGDDGYVKIWEI